MCCGTLNAVGSWTGEQGSDKAQLWQQLDGAFLSLLDSPGSTQMKRYQKQNHMVYERYLQSAEAHLEKAERDLANLKTAEIEIQNTRFDSRYPSCLRDLLKYDEKLADIATRRRNIQLHQEQLMRDAQLAHDQELRLLLAAGNQVDGAVTATGVQAARRRLVRRREYSGSPSKSPSTVSTEFDSHISDTDSESTDLESLPELADIFEAVERRQQATNNAQSDTETNSDDSSSSGSSSDGFHDDDEAEQVVDLEHYEFLEWLFCSGFSCDHRLHVMARHTEIGEPSVDIATVTEQ
ncbi:hypothetical protein V1523DRAFT_428735 [Lipomyces doorenjongii]